MQLPVGPWRKQMGAQQENRQGMVGVDWARHSLPVAAAAPHALLTCASVRLLATSSASVTGAPLTKLEGMTTALPFM